MRLGVSSYEIGRFTSSQTIAAGASIPSAAVGAAASAVVMNAIIEADVGKIYMYPAVPDKEFNLKIRGMKVACQ